MSRWMFAAWLIVAAMFVGSTLACTVYIDKFPEKIPTHYNIHGDPDDWTNRDQVFVPFFLIPVMTAGTIALGMVLPWLSPQQFKVDSFRRTYDFVFFLLAALFAWMHGFLMFSAASGSLDFRWFTGGMFLFFALLGNVLGKVRSNFWMGVRTPWTLASEVVWEKTHRVAAWLFVAAGLIGFVASIAGLSPIYSFGLISVAAFAPLIYSLVLYKRLEKAGQL